MSNLFNKQVWRFGIGFLRTWLALIGVLALVLWLLYRSELNALMSVTRIDEQHALQLARQHLSSELSMLRVDALYLAEHASLLEWLETGRPAARLSFSKDLLAFARHSRLYDQLRFIDAKGHERVRVNWQQGRPKVMPGAVLQNKARRYYVRDILQLPKGKLYISPFDLNIEQNTIQLPIKPMIRVGTPVFDQRGRKRGLIVLNYLGQQLLNRLRAVRREYGGELWLLNGDGYWLMGPDPAVEWAFMYPDHQAMRLQDTYRDTWAAIQAGPQRAQLLNEQGLFTYEWIEPEVTPDTLHAERWLLVGRLSSGQLAALQGERRRGFVITFLALAMLLAVVSVFVSRIRIQRRQAESRIRENEARYRGLLESAPDAIIIVDAKGQIVLVNSQAEKCFAYSREELLGLDVEQLVPEGRRGQHARSREDYLDAPSVRLMGAGLELSGLGKDGRQFPVEISLSPFQTREGRLLVTCVVRDISARKEADQVRSWFNAVLFASPDLVAIADAEGQLEFINEAGCKLMAYPNAEHLAGRHISALHPAHSQAVLQQAYATALSDGHWQGDSMLLTADGQEIPVSQTLVVHRGKNGDIDFFSTMIRDMRDRHAVEHKLRNSYKELEQAHQELKQAQQQLLQSEKMASIGQLAAGVAHEINNPVGYVNSNLGTLKMYIEQLLALLAAYEGVEGEISSGPARQRIAEVRKQIEFEFMVNDIKALIAESEEGLDRVKKIVQDLKEFSHVDEDTWAYADLHHGLDSTLNIVHNELKYKAEVIKEYGDMPEVECILSQINQVFMNILVNAAQAIEDHGRITLRSGCEAEQVWVEIEDSGSGMDETTRRRLFDPFYTTKPVGKGTGLGLSLGYNIIQKHHGEIQVESEPGRGTVFRIRLPITQPKDSNDKALAS